MKFYQKRETQELLYPMQLAFGHVWQFNLNKQKFTFQFFSCTSHYKCSQSISISTESSFGQCWSRDFLKCDKPNYILVVFNVYSTVLLFRKVWFKLYNFYMEFICKLQIFCTLPLFFFSHQFISCQVLRTNYIFYTSSLVAQVVKNLPTNAGDPGFNP